MDRKENDREIDAFIANYIREIEQSEPSVDFTANVMREIEETVAPVQPLSISEPLISTKGWFALSGFAAVMVLTLVMYSSPEISEVFGAYVGKYLNVSWQIPRLSHKTVYIAFFTALLIWVQFYYLKHFFTDRLNRE